ncbi:MAG: hypothetical protein KF802_04075 [Bdellovibrionaceae bacterium]|nr:hypothetical protein [Pseudobdellovibrionaceae bacterium]MBX3034429.1 hypothetical protein [Pseudobdellovibrionaceae bacterium]
MRYFLLVVGMMFAGSVMAAPVEASKEASKEAPPAVETVAESVKETAKEAGEKIDQAVVRVDERLTQARASRARGGWFAAVEYSYLDMILPSKFGLVVGKNRDQNTSWELEYLSGSIKPPGFLDRFGGLEEQRYSFLWRKYLGTNSFNLFAGVHYGKFTIQIGDAMLSRVAGTPTIDAMRLEAFGGTVGLGNRWTLKNGLTFGVDWLSWAQPLVVISRKAAFIDEAGTADDGSDARSAMNLVSYFPRFSAVKLHLGYSF